MQVDILCSFAAFNFKLGCSFLQGGNLIPVGLFRIFQRFTGVFDPRAARHRLGSHGLAGLRLHLSDLLHHLAALFLQILNFFLELFVLKKQIVTVVSEAEAQNSRISRPSM